MLSDMEIPFTVDQFYSVFRDYNLTVWPMQWLLVAMALAAVAAALRARPWSGVAVSAILGLLWAWIALAYHLVFFTRINPLAYAFAAFSLAGSAIFLWQGVIRRRLTFKWTPGLQGMAGAALMGFALIVYPIWSIYAGHRYPSTATFGLPCPTTIFTIGLLALLVPPAPRSTLIVPLLWCFVGAQAAFLLSVPPDLGLVAAAVVGIGLWINAGRRRQAAP